MAEIFETELCLTCNVWHVLGQACGCADTKQDASASMKGDRDVSYSPKQLHGSAV